MTDILVPVGPADLIDQMTQLQGQANGAPDLTRRAVCASRLARMERIAVRALPPLPDPSHDAVIAARHDVMRLEADLRACEARAEFGLGFIALTRAYLEALDVLDLRKTEYDAVVSAALPRSGDACADRSA